VLPERQLVVCPGSSITPPPGWRDIDDDFSGDDDIGLPAASSSSSDCERSCDRGCEDMHDAHDGDGLDIGDGDYGDFAYREADSDGDGADSSRRKRMRTSGSDNDGDKEAAGDSSSSTSDRYFSCSDGDMARNDDDVGDVADEDDSQATDSRSVDDVVELLELPSAGIGDSKYIHGGCSVEELIATLDDPACQGLFQDDYSDILGVAAFTDASVSPDRAACRALRIPEYVGKGLGCDTYVKESLLVGRGKHAMIHAGTTSSCRSKGSCKASVLLSLRLALAFLQVPMRTS
jgi:hypothetical protein